MAIDDAGNVGFGTGVPSSKLHLNGGDITVQTMEYSDVAGGYGEILFKDESTSKWGVDVLSDSDVNNSAKNRFQIFYFQLLIRFCTYTLEFLYLNQNNHLQHMHKLAQCFFLV